MNKRGARPCTSLTLAARQAVDHASKILMPAGKSRTSQMEKGRQSKWQAGESNEEDKPVVQSLADVNAAKQGEVRRGSSNVSSNTAKTTHTKSASFAGLEETVRVT